ncbi:hypothetical protein BH09PAT4_BH09PAT4_09370 [soil metagenome]
MKQPKQPRLKRITTRKLNKYLKDPDYIIKVAKRFGIPNPEDAVRNRSTFPCVIPGHDPLVCMAAIRKLPDGKYVYVDDLNNSRTSYYFQTVFQGMVTGTIPTEKTTNAMAMAYTMRLLIETGAERPYPVQLLPLPDDATEDHRRVYDGFKLHLGGAWRSMEPGIAMPFATSFAAPWCGFGSSSDFDQALGDLVKWGIIDEEPYMTNLPRYRPAVPKKLQ